MNNDPTGLNQIYHKLGNIEGKLDSLTHMMASHTTQDDVRFANIAVQLEGLQKSKWFNSGVSATVSSAITLVVLWLKGH